jgi:hypothetical protein
MVNQFNATFSRFTVFRGLNTVTANSLHVYQSVIDSIKKSQENAMSCIAFADGKYINPPPHPPKAVQ